LTDHILETLSPRQGTDVFEIDRHRSVIRPVLNETQMVVVKAKTAFSDGIAPGRQQISAKSLWQREPVFERNVAINVALLGRP